MLVNDDENYHISTVHCNSATAISEDLSLIRKGEKNIIHFLVPYQQVSVFMDGSNEISLKNKNSDFTVEVGCQVFELSKIKSKD